VLALAAIVVASAQATSTAWQHTLIRHERYEDFENGSGHAAWLGADYPLTLKAKFRALWLPGVTFYEFGRGEGDEPEDGLARYESPAIDVVGGFSELWLSWNVDCPIDAGFSVELRVAAAKGDWSPWLHVASSGQVAVPFARMGDFGINGEQPVFDAVAMREFDGGKIDVDHFVSNQSWDRLQYSVRARTKADSAEVRVRRVVLCASRRSASVDAQTPMPIRTDAQRRLDVPTFHDEQIQSDWREWMSLTSSVAMAAKYRGQAVAASMIDGLKAMRVDPVHDLSPAAIVDLAYRAGAPGFVERVGSWSEVENAIARRQPLVIRVEQDDSARRTVTWLVLCGFDERGNVLVNDPLAPETALVQPVIAREELRRTWLAQGGTALVFLPREEK
jgi:hypothetical protein